MTPEGDEGPRTAQEGGADLRRTRDEMTGALHERYFIDLVDDPTPDAPIAFRTLHEAIEWVKGYMRSAAEVTTDRRRQAARHGIAISRRGRLMALIRLGPDDGLKVTLFA